MNKKTIRWEDATNIAEWSTPDEVEEFAKNEAWIVENTGWVVYEDDKCVVIAGRRTIDNKHFGLFERIPRRAIIDGG